MKKILGFTAGIIILSSFLFNANIIEISAASFNDGLKQAGGVIGYSEGDENVGSLYTKVGEILNIATTFLGVIFLGLMIYAGFIWMAARGNEQEVAKAKTIIIYSVIGLAFVLGAYVIIKLIRPLWLQII
jgi:preprotein translocase subunit SecG